MARERERFDRKSLREDAFRDAMFVALDYVYRKRWYFIAGVGALVAAGIAVGLTLWYQAVQQERMATAYYEVERVQRDSALSADEREERKQAAMQSFLDEYGSSAMAPVALLARAEEAWAEERYADAGELYGQVLAHGAVTPAQRMVALVGQAKAREAEGDLEGAATLYGRLDAARYEDVRAFNLGRLAMAREDTETARQQLKTVTEKHPDSPLASRAQEMLAYLQ